MKYVMMATMGDAAEKASKCPWMYFFSRPVCIRKETKPKAAGAWKIKAILLFNTWSILDIIRTLQLIKKTHLV